MVDTANPRDGNMALQVRARFQWASASLRLRVNVCARTCACLNVFVRASAFASDVSKCPCFMLLIVAFPHSFPSIVYSLTPDLSLTH